MWKVYSNLEKHIQENAGFEVLTLVGMKTFLGYNTVQSVESQLTLKKNSSNKLAGPDHPIFLTNYYE
jgi:hypothetical protein